MDSIVGVLLPFVVAIVVFFANRPAIVAMLPPAEPECRACGGRGLPNCQVGAGVFLCADCNAVVWAEVQAAADDTAGRARGDAAPSRDVIGSLY